MMNKNKGFSLVEMIVTISILAIITSGSVMAYYRMSYVDTMKAAKTVSSVMDKLRIETMSKEIKPYLYLYNIDDTIYIKVSKESNSGLAGLDASSGEKVGKRIAVYVKEPSIAERVLGDGEYISISFVRSLGTFYSNYETITFVYHSKKAAIICVQETGRHWVE